MSEQDLVVRESSDLTNVLITANSPEQVQHMQRGLLVWAQKKLALVEAELQTAEDSVELAAGRGFQIGPLNRLAARAAARVTYYRKVIAALEAGYCLFPTTDVDIFAIRTDRRTPSRQHTSYRSAHEQKAQLLPIGHGRYINPIPFEASQAYEVDETKHDGTTVTKTRTDYYADSFDENGEFPLVMAKPEIIQIVSKTMALGLFDELGLLPQSRGADPVIVGRIVNPESSDARTRRRVSFLISWYVDSREI